MSGPASQPECLSVRRRFTASQVRLELPLIAAVADAWAPELRVVRRPNAATSLVPQARLQRASHLRLVDPALMLAHAARERGQRPGNQTAR